MTRKTRVWLLFLLFLFLLSLAASPYSKTVDRVLMGVRLTLVAIMSVLTVREWLWHQRDRFGSRRHSQPDAGDSLLRRIRRWYYDEQK
jgi:hypothetical protein